MARIEDYDYVLPPELIAQDPLEDRTASRLLVLHRKSGTIEHRQFRDCLEYLRSGDLLVMNDTRVTARRLFGRKADGGGKVETLLLGQNSDGTWSALVRPGRRLKQGAMIEFDVEQTALTAKVESVREDGQRLLRFNRDPSGLGQVPLPPYVTHILRDEERYQTVYARTGGSSASPTAGLHFTAELLDEVRERGIDVATVTLDVGLDTFRPVQSEHIEDHPMHGERCAVSADLATRIANTEGRVIAVGTTSVRTLESMALGKRRVEPGERTTQLFIRPGYEFQVVDAMFTNFHMPRTTMLMMLAALAGHEAVFAAYDQAIARGYRFLSFGDSMLII